MTYRTADASVSDMDGNGNLYLFKGEDSNHTPYIELRDKADSFTFFMDVDNARHLRAELGRLLGESSRTAYGCHCDLEEGITPDGCVLDYGNPDDCVRTRTGRVTKREDCDQWRPISFTARVAA